MTFIPDWKSILGKAWSVKFLALAGAVSAAEAVIQIAGVQLLPPGVGPAVIGLLSALGILARVMAQKEAEEVSK
jgi:hypothetical protein